MSTIVPNRVTSSTSSSSSQIKQEHIKDENNDNRITNNSSYNNNSFFENWNVGNWCWERDYNKYPVISFPHHNVSNNNVSNNVSNNDSNNNNNNKCHDDKGITDRRCNDAKINTTNGSSDDDVQNGDDNDNDNDGIDDDEKKPAAIKSSAFDSSCVATTSSGRDATPSAVEKATATKKEDVRKISGCRIKKEEEEDPQKDNNDVPNHQKDNRRSPNRYDERWMGMFQKLVEYKKQYKDTIVPRSYKYGPNLGIWVTTQRRYYKKGDLHPNQADLLKSIGFEWDGLKCKAVSNQMIWMDMFQKLVEKKQHKNTLVPQPYEEDPKLGQWVNMQRHTYKNEKLLPKRIYLLKSIGFDLEGAKAAI